MNSRVRAHRILARLQNFKKFGEPGCALPMPSGQQLGEPIGCYQNSERQEDLVGVFAQGLAWFENGRPLQLRFADIAGVSLPSGKGSKMLLLTMRDGSQHQLPVAGGRERFLDSMEMLRFLDRVLCDIKNQSGQAE